MEQRLTPRQLARATGVSESSIKRWCDAGEIATVRTPGGHRQIPLSSAIHFVREREIDLPQPELLGLPRTTRRGGQRWDEAREQLADCLARDDEATCRQLLFGLYLDKRRISDIGDRVIAPAFAQIGHQWETGELAVFQERRALEITRNLLHELRLAQSPPPSDGPVAVGGTVSGDNYALAPILVELVLRECGWRASYLGSNLPLDTLCAAVKDRAPRLLWLSISHAEDEARFLKEYQILQQQAGPHTALVVGGRGLHAELRAKMKYAAFCETLAHLETFAQTLQAAENVASP